MAGNRCDSCGKMVALEFQDPEVNDLEAHPTEVEDQGVVSSALQVTGTVEIKRNCAECGGGMKQSYLEIEETLEGGCPLFADGHEKTVEAELEQLEESGSRYKKSYFGAQGTISVTCACGARAEGSWSDKIAASDFDDV